MTRAQQKELTSKAILKASLTVFSEMDYNTATFSDISKIAKVTNGLIVQRFGSKEALYTQLVDEILLSRFPSFENCNNLYESLIEIIHFVKNTGFNSIENLKFCSIVFKSIYSIPNRCKERIEKIFTTAKLKDIFDVEVSGSFDKVIHSLLFVCVRVMRKYHMGKANEKSDIDNAILSVFIV